MGSDIFYSQLPVTALSFNYNYIYICAFYTYNAFYN